MVLLKLIFVVLFGLCSCQQPAVFSNGKSKTEVSNRMRATQNFQQYGKPNNWNNYGAVPNRNQYNNKSYMKNSRTSYLTPYYRNQVRKYQEYMQSQAQYKAKKPKTKPDNYKVRSISRTLVDQTLQYYMPWEACSSFLLNIIDRLFNPTSDFSNAFINEAIENFCGNKLYDILQPFISPYTDQIFDKLEIARE